jgi:hypothetical protein
MLATQAERSEEGRNKGNVYNMRYDSGQRDSFFKVPTCQ